MAAGSKVAIITGASRGLGLALAHAFAKAGYNLVLTARDRDALAALKAELETQTGRTVATVAADLADGDAAELLLRSAQERFPRIDVLINNAATQGPIGSLWDNDWAAWARAVRTDLMAPVALCRAFAPAMIAAGRGSIINISGGGATGPRPKFTAYATAKAGLVRFSETLAAELAPFGVGVNCIAPGAMNTRMLAEVEAAGETAGPKELAVVSKVRAQGGASMERVAKLCLYLSSDEAKDVTGKLISAVWDPWEAFPEHAEELKTTDIYTLRRIVPRDRGKTWGNDL